MIAGMDLPAPLAWLVDEAGASPDPERFLAELGGRLLAHGLPLAGGALTLAVPHPIIARRTWLWRAETGAVIEALGFVGGPPDQAGRNWLAKLGPVQEETVGATPGAMLLGWAGTRPFEPSEAGRLRQVARFGAAPGRARRAPALAALLEACSRPAQCGACGLARSAAAGETIVPRCSMPTCATSPRFRIDGPAAVIAALDAWLPHRRRRACLRRRGAEIHRRRRAGDLPVRAVPGSPADACAAALRPCRRAAAWSISTRSGRHSGCRRCRSARRCISARSVGQYRRGRPAGLHRHRPRGQSGQPARGCAARSAARC